MEPTKENESTVDDFDDDDMVFDDEYEAFYDDFDDFDDEYWFDEDFDDELADFYEHW